MAWLPGGKPGAGPQGVLALLPHHSLCVHRHGESRPFMVR